nr:UPF0496 protein At3g19330-like [Ipomoea batatas]GMD86772.1 UPF0496 protein At3g19330-like [Ipomoea batatas]
MIPCFGQSSTTTNNHLRPSALDGYSVENTPQSGVQISPTVNLRRAYTLAVQTPSFGEIWTKIHQEIPSEQNVDVSEVNVIEEPLQLEEVLKPSREDVEEALSDIIIEDTFTQQVVNFFNHSEETARKCLLLSESVHRARHLYAPLHKLVDILPSECETVADSLSPDQCDSAFKVFLQFDKLDNPFPGIDSDSSFNDMHACYFQLKEQLDLRIEHSHSKVHLLRHATKGSAICLLVAAVGVVTCAILIATPALIVLVATPAACPPCLPLKITKKESAHLVQLDDASRETFVLDNHLETLDCLVDPLHNSVEGFKRDVRFVLERSKDSYSIQEVLKQLRRKNHKFLDQLTRLEEHLCLCFAAINRARSILLNYLLIHQLHSS